MLNYCDLAASLSLTPLMLIAVRRDTVLLKVRRGRQSMALKVSNPTGESEYDTTALLLHEAAILQEISRFGHDLYVDQGYTPPFGRWLLMRWVKGKSVENIAWRIRGCTRSRQPGLFSALFSTILQAYAPFHAAGYLHRDVQPDHLITERRANPVIIDWALGWRPHGPNPDYRGALIHYIAPEIARWCLQKLPNMPYNLACEMYSIGATFYHCYTGLTPIEYGETNEVVVPLSQKIQAVADGCFRGFPQPTTQTEAQLQAAIAACLSGDPRARCPSVQAALAMLP